MSSFSSIIQVGSLGKLNVACHWWKKAWMRRVYATERLENDIIPRELMLNQSFSCWWTAAPSDNVVSHRATRETTKLYIVVRRAWFQSTALCLEVIYIVDFDCLTCSQVVTLVNRWEIVFPISVLAGSSDTFEFKLRGFRAVIFCVGDLFRV